jgi:penicillin-binding protein 2
MTEMVNYYCQSGILWHHGYSSRTKNIDTLEFCHLPNITKEDYIKNLQKSKSLSPRLFLFFTQLNKSEFAAFQKKRSENLKVSIFKKRSLRDYEVDFGANVFDYQAIAKPYYNRVI